ncbi:MAG TPA: HEAT repeat domain-containing protein [Acidimicrobiales bacterium]|nr:HEAT repeat domain-containing protein [Acidimicrobiales bacterium]
MEAEARRRRAVAVAGHTGDAGTVRNALDDPAPSVRQGALVALARIGSLSCQELQRALGDPDAGVRRRACEVAGRLGTGNRLDVEQTADAGDVATENCDELVAALRCCADDGSPQVCEAACYSLGERPGRDVTTTVLVLIRVAGNHPEALCREAAIAALGSIGDPLGLEAVVAALSDKLGVRRRATVALAAFDGPVAEAALRRAATSRDWQTRQAAEDLLGDRRSQS